jgi:hypothetical protein
VARVAKRTREPWWLLVVIVIAGAMLGSVFADAVGQSTYLAPLGRSLAFGIDPPITLDLHVLTVTFGLTLRLNLAMVAGIIAAVFLFRVL